MSTQNSTRIINNKLIKDTQHALTVFQKLHSYNQTLTFWNHSHTFRVFIRNEEVLHSTKMHFEIGILADPDIDCMHIKEALHLEADGYFEDDEDTSFIFDSFTISREPSQEELTSAIDSLERVYALRLCDCNSYLLKDPQAMCCLHCYLTNSKEEMAEHFCPICLENALTCHTHLTNCCNQRLHKRCLKEWQENSEESDSRCVLCRQLDMKNPK
jgi:hypothetical protein